MGFGHLCEKGALSSHVNNRARLLNGFAEMQLYAEHISINCLSMRFCLLVFVFVCKFDVSMMVNVPFVRHTRKESV